MKGVDALSKYYSIHEFSKIIGVSAQTLRNWDANGNQVEKVVVLYKDRLLRLGFELIEYIASLYNCEIEIIDNTEKSEQQELVEDLVQIITVFSCKLQGKRANKAKKLIRELMQQEETDGKSHKSNVDTKQRTEN